MLSLHSLYIPWIAFITDTITWTAADDEKKVEEAQIFIDKMCPGAGFNDVNTNINLLKAFAVGRSNFIPVISIFMEMFELSLINEELNPPENEKKKFSDVSEWSENRCKWPKSYKNDLKDATPKSIIENGCK